MGNLTAAKIKAILDKPGRYSDGDGLILFVRSPGQASWVARVQHKGKRRDYGIGSAKLYTLAEARDRAWQVRRALADGRDPRLLWERPAPLLLTFREAAERFLDKGCKAGDKRRLGQYPSQLARYAYPVLGKLQVQSIDADRIADCLRPIWKTKPVTAQEVRRLIVSAVSFVRPDAGKFEGDMSRAVAARLPSQPGGGNFDALPYEDVPALMGRLKDKAGIAALALRFTILTAARSGEVRKAQWHEIDFNRAVWSVPAEHTKTRKPHFVPLASEALAVLEEAKALRQAGTNHIFPSSKGGALSDMALTTMLRRMGLKCTAHGFRSSFRDWAAERGFDDNWAEAALAHSVAGQKGDTVAAYLRTTYFNDRRDKLMPAWGSFAVGEESSADVVQLDARR